MWVAPQRHRATPNADHTGGWAGALVDPGFRRFFLASTIYHGGVWCAVLLMSWQSTMASAWSAGPALVQCAFALPVLLVAFFVGRLSDRGPTKSLVVWAVAAAAAIAVIGGVVGIGMAPTTIDVTSLSLLFGVAFALVMPGWNSWGAELVPAGRVIEAAVLGAFNHSLTRGISFLTVGYLLDRLGTRFAFLVCAGLLLIAAMLFLMTPRRKPTLARGERMVSALAGERVPGGKHIYVLAANFAATVGVFWSVLPILLRDMGLGADDFGMTMALFGFGSAIGTATIHMFGRIMPIRFALLLSGAILSVSLAGMPLFEGTVGSCVFLVGAAWAILNAILLGWVISRAPGGSVGRACGLYLTVSYGGTLGGSTLAWLSANVFPAETLLMLCASLVAAGSTLALLGVSGDLHRQTVRSIRRTTEPGEPN